MNDIIKRFKEPSSYAALTGVLAMICVNVSSDLLQNIVMLCCGAAGVAGFWIRENKE